MSAKIARPVCWLISIAHDRQTATLERQRQREIDGIGDLPMNISSSPGSSTELRLPIAKQLLAAISNAGISFVLVLFLAQHLGPARFGDYAALLSLAVVLLIPIEGGWPARVYRDGVSPSSQGAAPLLLANGLAHVITLAALFAVVGALLAGEPTAWVAGMLCMATVATMNLVSGRLRALGRFGGDALWQTGGRVLSASLIVLAVLYVSSSIATVFFAWALGLLAMLLLIGPRLIDGQFDSSRLSWPRLSGWLPAMHGTLAFLIVEACMALLTKGDVAILKSWGAEDAALSFYAVCTRFNEMALLLWAPVGNVLLRQFRLQHADAGPGNNTWMRWAGLALGFGGAAIGGAWLAGEQVVHLLFGDDYRGAGALLPYTASMLPFALCNLVLVVALMAKGQERWLAWRLLPAAMLLVLAMGLGWNWGGGAGAALGVAASHAVLAVLAWRKLRVGRSVDGGVSVRLGAPYG